MGEKHPTTGESLRQWWRRAADEKRLPPGNGPEHTRRILPSRLPFRRKEAMDSGTVTRHKLDRLYVEVARGVLFLELGPETPRQVTGDHPGEFLVDIITRARAQWLRHRDLVTGSWAAAAFHGLLYWADSAPVLLLTDKSHRHTGGGDGTGKARLRPVIRRWPACLTRETVCPDPKLPELRCVTAPVAAAQCLKSVFMRSHHWVVPEVPGLTDVQVRAVQLIDAFLQCTTVTVDEIMHACRGLVSARKLREVLPLVDPGAQSPRETLLRLVVRDILPDGHRWTSQVRLDLPTETWTVLDLACASLKVALYYDGSTHQDAGQNQKDIDQLQELKDLGWEVVRVDAALFADRRRLLRLVSGAISRAAAVAAAAA
jgi:very-short-patch-repair endonuclease